MGVPWIRDQATIAAFKADWNRGTPLAELAAMYGYTNINSITRVARRFGLEPRRAPNGTHRPRWDRTGMGLTGGRWEVRRGVRVWVEDD